MLSTHAPLRRWTRARSRLPRAQHRVAAQLRPQLGRKLPAGPAPRTPPAAAPAAALPCSRHCAGSALVARDALDPEHAAQEVARGAGTQFDPDMAHAFLQWLRDGRIQLPRVTVRAA